MNTMAGWKYQRYCWLETRYDEYCRDLKPPLVHRSRRWKYITLCVMLLCSVSVVIGCTTELQPLPPTESQREARPPSLPQKCRHLYNVGRHKEWADCMGVGYR